MFIEISGRYFYILKAQGLAPDLTRLGKNLRITHEAAKEWIKQCTEQGSESLAAIAEVSTPSDQLGCAP